MVLDYKTHKRDKYQYEVVSPMLRSHHLQQGRIGPDTVGGDTWTLTGDHRSGWSQHQDWLQHDKRILTFDCYYQQDEGCGGSVEPTNNIRW